MLNRCKYSFRWQWPVRSRVIHTTCFRCCSAPYSLSPVVVPDCWLIFRSRFAFALPVLHSISHLILVMDLIDLFWADLILVVEGRMEFGIAAVFAA